MASEAFTKSHLPLITRKDVCTRLAISDSTLYRLERAGVMRPIEVSPGNLRYSQEDIDDYIENQRRGPNLAAAFSTTEN